jgi:hypothetical protein
MSKPKTKHAPNSGPLNFRQRDVERAIRAARTMGLPIGSVQVCPRTGKITITAGTPNDATAAELDEWVARKNARQA